MYMAKSWTNFDLGTTTLQCLHGPSEGKESLSLLVLLRTTKSEHEDEFLINFLLLSGHVMAVLDVCLGLIVLQCKWQYNGWIQDSVLTKV